MSVKFRRADKKNNTFVALDWHLMLFNNRSSKPECSFVWKTVFKTELTENTEDTERKQLQNFFTYGTQR
jgi:hypothetical protein